MLFLLAFVFLFGFGFGFEKKYSLSLTQPEIMKVLYVVDQSNAAHQQVKEVQEIFTRELKQHIDSTGRLK